MGCKWTNLGSTNRVSPANRVIPAVDDVVVAQPNVGLFPVTLKQFPSNDVEHSNQDNENIDIDGSINQSSAVPLENLKPSLTDESKKRKEIVEIYDVTNSPTPSSVKNLMQTFEQKSALETTDEHLSQRINSTTSNKRPQSAESQEEKDDHHSKKLNDETISIASESIVEENINDSAISENILSKRITSGTSNKVEDDIVSMSDASVVDTAINTVFAPTNDHVEIIDADLEAFNTLFVKQRQDALDNTSYRSTIESWKPNSLQQLVKNIESLSKGKVSTDCHWIIFYWIACNIEYDVVSFLNDNIPGQSVEKVFSTRKAVCAGYSRLYKYLCDQVGLKCEEISGYAKGYGYDNREEGVLLKTDHAWNTIEIDSHWYLLDSTWGTGHLNEQNMFERKLNCFYFLTRPHQMIYDHLPEDDKWQLLRTPINMNQYTQMPKIQSSYFDLNLQLISPLHQAYVSLVPNKSYALVLIRTTPDVELIGNITDNDGIKIKGGEQIYYDQQKSLWICKFAPNRDGLFKAHIFGKKKSDTGSYSAVLSFKVKATQIPSSPLSYPHTWQIFHDLHLKVEAPKNCSSVTWPANASYVEILIRAPDDVQLSCATQHNSINIKNGSLAQFDHDKKLWQLLFAPESIGQHELIVFAKRSSEKKSGCALKFYLNVTQLYRKPMKFPTIYDKFHLTKSRIYEPLDGILKKGTTVPIHCVIPGANEVDLQVDSKWAGAQGYQDSILKRKITVGSKDVTIYAKYGQKSSYDGLIKYTVQ